MQFKVWTSLEKVINNCNFDITFHSYIAFIYPLLNYLTNDLMGTDKLENQFSVNLSMETWDSDIPVFMPLSKKHWSKHNGRSVGRQNTVFLSFFVTPRS